MASQITSAHLKHFAFIYFYFEKIEATVNTSRADEFLEKNMMKSFLIRIKFAENKKTLNNVKTML